MIRLFRTGEPDRHVWLHCAHVRSVFAKRPRSRCGQDSSSKKGGLTVMKDIIDQNKKKILFLSLTWTGGIARGVERRTSRESAGAPSLSIWSGEPYYFCHYDQVIIIIFVYMIRWLLSSLSTSLSIWSGDYHHQWRQWNVSIACTLRTFRTFVLFALFYI